MQIKSINISRRESYDRTTKAEFKAKVCVEGGSNYPADINLDIHAEMLSPIMSIVAQMVVESMARATAEFESEVHASLAGPAIEQEAITDQVEPI